VVALEVERANHLATAHDRDGDLRPRRGAPLDVVLVEEHVRRDHHRARTDHVADDALGPTEAWGPRSTAVAGTSRGHARDHVAVGCPRQQHAAVEHEDASRVVPHRRLHRVEQLLQQFLQVERAAHLLGDLEQKAVLGLEGSWIDTGMSAGRSFLDSTRVTQA